MCLRTGTLLDLARCPYSHSTLYWTNTILRVPQNLRILRFACMSSSGDKAAWSPLAMPKPSRPENPASWGAAVAPRRRQRVAVLLSGWPQQGAHHGAPVPAPGVAAPPARVRRAEHSLVAPRMSHSTAAPGNTAAISWASRFFSVFATPEQLSDTPRPVAEPNDATATSTEWHMQNFVQSSALDRLRSTQNCVPSMCVVCG
eukprot:COSAG01_NODE_13544_length_1569_cov_2.808163_1_plen_201_part_00